MTTPVQQPLTGFTVLVTRPAGQSEGLARLIAGEGGQVVLGPLLSIAPVDDASAALELLTTSQAWDWVIFISANAVRGALALGDRVRQGLTTCRIAAVGEATANELAGAGLPVALVPYPAFNSEALLADPRMAQVAEQQILIVRGEGGREHLADVLQERGAQVSYAEVYRRVPVATEVFRPLLSRWRESGSGSGYDAVVVTSGEALTRLTSLLGELALSGLPRPQLVVPSERIARLAAEQGWPAIMVAEQAADEAIVQSLKRLAHARKTGHTPIGLILAAPVVLPEPPPTPTPTSDLPGESNHENKSHTAQDLDGEKPLTDQDKDIQPVADSAADTAPTTASSKKAVDTGKAKPPKKPRSLAWVGYSMLLGVIALGIGGWFLLQELRSRQEGLGGQISDKTQQVQEVTHQISSMQAEMAALHSQVATLQNQFSSSDAKTADLLTDHGDQFELKLQSTRTELATAIQQIQRQLNRTRGDLLIADAEYLLNVANQKLNLSGDVKSVFAAMEAADQRLHESGDPAVFKVRETLAEEMGALRKMQVPDLVGVSSRLVALEKKVAVLPLNLPHAGTLKEHEKEKKTAPAHQQQPVAGEEGDALDTALQGIKDLVTVRRTDHPVEAVLTPAQVEAIRQILLLKLESSRAALLRNDEQLYRDSLATATDWIGQHFDVNAPETRSVLDELASLGDRSFNVTYPDISKSMVMLQNIEKLRLEAEEAAISGKKPATATPQAEIKAPAVPEVAITKDAKGQKAEKQPVNKKGKSPASEGPATPQPPAATAPSGVPEAPSAKPEDAAGKTPESESGPGPAAAPESGPAQEQPVAPSGEPEAKPAVESGERL